MTATTRPGAGGGQRRLNDCRTRQCGHPVECVRQGIESVLPSPRTPPSAAGHPAVGAAPGVIPVKRAPVADSAARCIWPIDPDATGSLSNSANRSTTPNPKYRRTAAWVKAKPCAGACARGSARGHAGWRSGAGQCLQEAARRVARMHHSRGGGRAPERPAVPQACLPRTPGCAAAPARRRGLVGRGRGEWQPTDPT